MLGTHLGHASDCSAPLMHWPFETKLDMDCYVRSSLRRLGIGAQELWKLLVHAKPQANESQMKEAARGVHCALLIALKRHPCYLARYDMMTSAPSLRDSLKICLSCLSVSTVS